MASNHPGNGNGPGQGQGLGPGGAEWNDDDLEPTPRGRSSQDDPYGFSARPTPPKPRFDPSLLDPSLPPRPRGSGLVALAVGAVIGSLGVIGSIFWLFNLGGRTLALAILGCLFLGAVLQVLGGLSVSSSIPRRQKVRTTPVGWTSLGVGMAFFMFMFTFLTGVRPLIPKERDILMMANILTLFGASFAVVWATSVILNLIVFIEQSRRLDDPLIKTTTEQAAKRAVWPLRLDAWLTRSAARTDAEDAPAAEQDLGFLPAGADPDRPRPKTSGPKLDVSSHPFDFDVKEFTLAYAILFALVMGASFISEGGLFGILRGTGIMGIVMAVWMVIFSVPWVVRLTILQRPWITNTSPSLR